MAKKIIQVPVEEGLLTDLDNLSRKQRKTRSELIRQACHRYICEMEYEELDRIYQHGYTGIPEEPEIGETQISLAGEVLPKEQW